MSIASNTSRALLAAVLLLLLPLHAQAQDLDAVRGGGGFAGLSIRTLDLKDLNTTLRRNGYPAFRQNMLAIGGGGYAVRGRLLFGGEGYALTGQNQERDDGAYATTLSGGFGTLNLGYLAARAEGFTVYPLLGLGGAGVQLRIDERAAPAFQEVLEMPGRGSDLATGSLLLTFSLGLDYQLSGNRSADRMSGLVMGIRTGYSSSIASGDWTERGGQSLSGPEVGLNGFFATFTLGARRLRPTYAF